MRGRWEKGNPVPACQDRLLVSPYLVEDITVLGYPISPDDDFVDTPDADHVPDGGIRYQGAVYPVLCELKGCQSCALKGGSSLRDEDLYQFPLLHRGPYHSQSSTVAHSCQSSGIALGQDGIAVID